MKRIIRLFTAVALAGFLTGPVVVLADLNDGTTTGGTGHADDPVGMDDPSTMPDEMDRNDPDPLDDGDAAGDAPLDENADPLEDDLDRQDQGLEDPLDEPANIPADPGM